MHFKRKKYKNWSFFVKNGQFLSKMVNFCQKLQKMVIFDKKKIIQKLVFLGQFNGFFVNLIFFKEKNKKICQFLSNENNFLKKYKKW